MNPFAWYYINKSNFDQRSHRRRTCKECMSMGIGVGCTLPFRKSKPKWFKGIRLNVLQDTVNDRRKKR